MRLVLDTNIFFSLMNSKSVSSYIFSFIDTEFFAPEFLKQEFNKYKSECLIKSGLSEHELEIRQKEIEETVEFAKASEYEEFLEEAVDLISDTKDIDFLALALSTNSPIWSNDTHLKKQSLVRVFTTEELIKFILGYSL